MSIIGRFHSFSVLLVVVVVVVVTVATVPPWLEPVFDEVLEGKERKTEGEASRSSSSGGNRKTGKTLPSQGGSLELNIEGSEGEVDIDVSLNSKSVAL